ncbi:hypothetical protein ED733_001448 [Metarhizium rileyi]|uniref:Uncharacterized protein n=1 Tax=Metarhizium rileyi (strain RCEF 4871) TaxID=1649241 RepID=A0A5C6GDX4_METRR|nr:hypothetical protein ED733_001448 [Metarhizium rileyi]
MKFSTAVVAAYAPYLAIANVRIPWYFPENPSNANGLEDVTFPMSLSRAKREVGYYFAQQLSFHGISGSAYIGLQPRPDVKGHSIIHAAFSSFQNGTTTSHLNCYNGADSGPAGVSCAISITGNYSHTYDLTAKNIGNTTWQGYLTNTITGESHDIGAWTLPSDAGNIRTSHDGFVEYYNWNSIHGSKTDCPNQPRTDVTFYNPSSTTGGALDGQLRQPEEFGDCNGMENLQSASVGRGYQIAYGRIQSCHKTSATNETMLNIMANAFQARVKENVDKIRQVPGLQHVLQEDAALKAQLETKLQAVEDDLLKGSNVEADFRERAVQHLADIQKAPELQSALNGNSKLEGQVAETVRNVEEDLCKITLSDMLAAPAVPRR